jgi:hypothetical protein
MAVVVSEKAFICGLTKVIVIYSYIKKLTVLNNLPLSQENN